MQGGASAWRRLKCRSHRAEKSAVREATGVSALQVSEKPAMHQRAPSRRFQASPVGTIRHHHHHYHITCLQESTTTSHHLVTTASYSELHPSPSRIASRHRRPSHGDPAVSLFSLTWCRAWRACRQSSGTAGSAALSCRRCRWRTGTSRTRCWRSTAENRHGSPLEGAHNTGRNLSTKQQRKS